MEVPQEIKNRATIWPSNPTSGYAVYPNETKSLSRRDKCSPMFLAALLTITKVWKQPKCLLTDEWEKLNDQKQKSHSKGLKKFFKHLFIYLFYLFIFRLSWVFVAPHGLSLVAASGGYSSLQCTGFSSWWLLLLWSTGSRRVGFSSCCRRVQ